MNQRKRVNLTASERTRFVAALVKAMPENKTMSRDQVQQIAVESTGRKVGTRTITMLTRDLGLTIERRKRRTVKSYSASSKCTELATTGYGLRLVTNLIEQLSTAIARIEPDLISFQMKSDLEKLSLGCTRMIGNHARSAIRAAFTGASQDAEQPAS